MNRNFYRRICCCDLHVILLFLTAFFFVPALGDNGVPAFSIAGQDRSRDNIKPNVIVEIVSSVDAAVGRQFELEVVLNVRGGGHLYANPKQGELGIDTEIVPEPIDGVRFGKVVYPAGEKYEDKVLQTSNHIYQGRVVCRLPVEVREFAGELPGSVEIKLNLTGLYCADDGKCIPWADSASVKINNLLERVVADDGQLSEVWLNLLAALAAGMLLNLMPCVLPVIPLKVLSLLQQGQAARQSGDRYKAVKLSLVFACGILLVFVVLALMMSVFQLLYGQQFQSSAFKFVMLMIVFVLGLSMFGVFEIVIPGQLTNISLVREGYLGAFGMGVLATLLATPCSAPLLGPVLAWSLNKTTGVTVAIFLIVGVGMSAPYVLLTAFPKLLDRLPKAGGWMLRLKEGLAFVMLAVAVYLIFLFEPNWHLPLVVFCIVLAFCCWLSMKVVNFASPVKHKIIARTTALILLIGASVYLVGASSGETKTIKAGQWLEFKQQALQNGKSVFVDFTADWCPNCKYVEKTVLERQAFNDKLVEVNAELVIADWTHYDSTITAELNRLGSKSIPFAAIYPAGEPDKPIILRDIYTLDRALRALDKLKSGDYDEKK